jgi:hypothetical protein
MKRDLSFLKSSTRRSGAALPFVALLLVVQACSSSSGTAVKPDAASKLDAPFTDGPSSAADAASDVTADSADVATDAAVAAEAGLPDVGGKEAAPVPLDSAAEASSPDAVQPAVDGGQGLDAVAMDSSGEAGSAGFTCPAQVTPDSGVTQQLCFDFGNPANAAAFTPEAGTWSVAGGVYIANGPDAQVTCPGGDGSLMTASVLKGLSARDVRVHAKLLSVQTPDKVLVLRSRPGGNRIEVNFRASFVYQDTPQGGDLNVAELVNCVDTTYVGPDGSRQVSIPHAIGQAIVVDVQLIGQQLTVIVDGRTVFDASVPVSTEPGSVGFAVFSDAVANFDDLLVEVLN